MSLHVIDGIEVTDSQWIGWCADEEREQRPQIRATFRNDYPFCITTPSGEPIRSYRQYKHAFLALKSLEAA